MKCKNVELCLFVCIVLGAVIAAEPALSETVKFICPGVPDPVIVVGAGATESERFAAEELSTHLEEMRDLPHVGETRQKGLMAGIELVKSKKTKEPFPMGLRKGHQVILEARRRGAILRPLGDVLVVMPPLAISSRELGRLMEILKESLLAVVEEQ